MNRISIDLSILSSSSRFCKVSGDLLLPIVPVLEDKIVFPSKNEYWDLFDTDVYIAVVASPFAVRDRTIMAKTDGMPVVLVLNDIEVQ